MANPKYSLTTVVTDSKNTVVFNGIPLLDSIIPKLPTAGKFTVEFTHGNSWGFAKMVYWLDKIGSLVGSKVVTACDWKNAAMTGKNIPESVKIEFDSKETAITALYCSWIPAMVSGGWKQFPDDANGCFAIWLKHIQENGIKMFLFSGEFCSGRLLPLRNKEAKATAVINEIMKAKKAVASVASKPVAASPEVSKTTKTSKTGSKGKTTRRVTKPAVTPDASPEADSTPEVS